MSSAAQRRRALPAQVGCRGLAGYRKTAPGSVAVLVRLWQPKAVSNPRSVTSVA